MQNILVVCGTQKEAEYLFDRFVAKFNKNSAYSADCVKLIVNLFDGSYIRFCGSYSSARDGFHGKTVYGRNFERALNIYERGNHVKESETPE